LKFLSASGNKLEKLPKWLGSFSQLQTLHLESNKLSSLPDEVGNLTQLQDLNISGNQLRTLPKAVGHLNRLVSLDASFNQLISIPETIGNISHLKSLNISINKLRTLPDTLVNLVHLQHLNLSYNLLTAVPEWLGNLISLSSIDLSENQLTDIPKRIGTFKELKSLDLAENRLTTLPESIVKLEKLETLNLTNNLITVLPESIGSLRNLQQLYLSSNQITDLPVSMASIKNLQELNLNENPLNPEIATTYRHGLDAIKTFLRAKAAAQITLNEAKLILVGEGEVGKTCLIDALLGNEWKEHDTTHGIQIQQIKVTDPETQTKITLNSWDFGGQRVYRPTHQLFFSAPAVYLVVWKPREGSQAGQVKEWVQLVKRREPSAKIIVVATHGGPRQRQPDIDRQELWDLFGKDTVIDFFFVDSKPNEQGIRKGMEELKQAIAKVAIQLPEVGRSVPKSFADVRQVLQDKSVPYLPLQEVLAICYSHKMDDEIAKLFITISHRLGHLTHYENDPTLRDIVILRPDWLATAMSYVLDDEETRIKHGLVNFSRLSCLWNDPTRPVESRYPESLHQIFLRLMERFDLSYRVADPSSKNKANPISLIGQLVPDIRPSNIND
ncbi:MAG TPA: COR domain-containing protein, partial [Bacteroidales bacterium]|nr:COR domain-containing protein [Bacteroidales bacterium]